MSEAKFKLLRSKLCRIFASAAAYNGKMADSSERVSNIAVPARDAYRLRFSLRALLLVVTLVASSLGAWHALVRPYRVQKLAAQELRERGAEVELITTGSAWSQKVFGADHFEEIVGISFAVPPLTYVPYYDDDTLEMMAKLDAVTYGPLHEPIIIGRLVPQPYRSQLPSAVRDDDLASLPMLRCLQTLSLRHSNVSDETLRRLPAGAPLIELHLDGTQITSDGLQHILKYPSLERLSLSNCAIGPRGLSRLSHLPRLRELDLSRCPITNADLEHLASFPSLEVLSLSRTATTDEGVAQIVKCSRLASLKLNSTHISAAALPVLAEMKTLRSIRVWDTTILQSDIDAFQRQRPDVSTRPKVVRMPVEVSRGSARIVNADSSILEAEADARAAEQALLDEAIRRFNQRDSSSKPSSDREPDR